MPQEFKNIRVESTVLENRKQNTYALVRGSRSEAAAALSLCLLSPSSASEWSSKLPLSSLASSLSLRLSRVALSLVDPRPVHRCPGKAGATHTHRRSTQHVQTARAREPAETRVSTLRALPLFLVPPVVVETCTTNDLQLSALLRSNVETEKSDRRSPSTFPEKKERKERNDKRRRVNVHQRED